MDKQAKNLSPVPVSKLATDKATTLTDKTSLGKRKISESEGDYDSSDALNSVIMEEPRKKTPKVTHSNSVDGELVEKVESEIMVVQSFVQTKIACTRGWYHTITLSNDGTLYSFGKNDMGQLGLGHFKKEVSIPTPIPNLPKISEISCGMYFTVCVDCEGFIWSFGDNDYGQLGAGTGNQTIFYVPQKLLNIPPVVSVSCGATHTLIITNDDNLWSWGNNYGQLCHGDKEHRSKPQQTSFSNISKISAGSHHSIFQNNNGEIFACGFNQYGECGLGHFNHPQITPSLILNAPSNIIHFVCGGKHCLFLDSEGNVFSVGKNAYGQLGLGHNTNQNELNKIPNIPPIKIISCTNGSSYLIDFEGNLWSFGYNRYGQLGHGDTQSINAPKIVNTLKDIQQISYGCNGNQFLAKNSQNQIFVTGNNDRGQLGTGDTQSLSIPKEINSQYSNIWRDEFHTRAKSARK